MSDWDTTPSIGVVCVRCRARRIHPASPPPALECPHCGGSESVFVTGGLSFIRSTFEECGPWDPVWIELLALRKRLDALEKRNLLADGPAPG